MQLSASDIADMLALRIGDLVRELLPGGMADGNEWRVGSPAGEKGKSMAVHLRGAKAGVWQDFGSNVGGDALKLVAVCLFGGDQKEAYKWAKSWLGCDNLDHKRLQQKQFVAQQAARQREADALLEADKKKKRAVGLWMGARADILNTPVHDYLMHRAIDVRLLPRLPGALRFTTKCWCADLRAEVPAMVAAIINGQNEHIATHRTYLARDTDGVWRKDKRLKEAKKVLASFRGGFISVNRGASNKPISKAPEGDRLILCEGIEDALTLALACPEYRVIAGVSLGNYNNIDLPPAIRDITIAADNDGDNAQAQRALNNAIERFQSQGRVVRIARSSHGKDFNDQLQAQHAAPDRFDNTSQNGAGA